MRSAVPVGSGEYQMVVDDDIVDDVEDDVLLQDDFEHEGADDVDDGLLQDEELAPSTPAAEFAPTTHAAEFSLTTPVAEPAPALSADEQKYIKTMERCLALRLLFGTGPT